MAPPEVFRIFFLVKVEVNTPVIHRWFGSSVMFSSSYKFFSCLPDLLPIDMGDSCSKPARFYALDCTLIKTTLMPYLVVDMMAQKFGEEWCMATPQGIVGCTPTNVPLWKIPIEALYSGYLWVT